MLCRILFGHNASYYALYGLYDKSISIWPDYMSSKTKSRLLNQMNSPKYKYLARNKVEFFGRCRSNNIPTPDVLAILSKNESSVSHKLPVITDVESLQNFLNQYDNQMLTPLQKDHHRKEVVSAAGMETCWLLESTGAISL